MWFYLGQSIINFIIEEYGEGYAYQLSQEVAMNNFNPQF